MPKDLQEGEVDQKVDPDHRTNSNHQTSQDVLIWILNFAGDE